MALFTNFLSVLFYSNLKYSKPKRLYISLVACHMNWPLLLLSLNRNRVAKTITHQLVCNGFLKWWFWLSDSSNGVTTTLYSCCIKNCPPLYQLSSLVALWADSSPLVMKVDTRDCNSWCSTRRVVVISQYQPEKPHLKIFPGGSRH